MSQQFHSCFLNSTNVVGDFLIGINSQSSDNKEVDFLLMVLQRIHIHNFIE